MYVVADVECHGTTVTHQWLLTLSKSVRRQYDKHVVLWLLWVLCVLCGWVSHFCFLRGLSLSLLNPLLFDTTDDEVMSLSSVWILLAG